MKQDPPFVCNLIERDVAYIPYTGDFTRHPEIYQELDFKLCRWAGPKGLLKPKEVFISSYRPDPQAESKFGMALDVCMTIPEGTRVDTGIRKKILPGGIYAVRRVELSEPVEYMAAWEEFSKWLVNSDYKADMTRPSNELYLSDPKENPDEDHIVYLCQGIEPK